MCTLKFQQSLFSNASAKENQGTIRTCHVLPQVAGPEKTIKIKIKETIAPLSTSRRVLQSITKCRVKVSLAYFNPFVCIYCSNFSLQKGKRIAALFAIMFCKRVAMSGDTEMRKGRDNLHDVNMLESK